MIKNKSTLKEIAKRYAKGLLLSQECSIAFDDTILTPEEIDYISSIICKIANNITNLPEANYTNDLVEEYFLK
jgi:hypothetical protein